MRAALGFEPMIFALLTQWCAFWATAMSMADKKGRETFRHQDNGSQVRCQMARGHQQRAESRSGPVHLRERTWDLTQSLVMHPDMRQPAPTSQSRNKTFTELFSFGELIHISSGRDTAVLLVTVHAVHVYLFTVDP